MPRGSFEEGRFGASYSRIRTAVLLFLIRIIVIVTYGDENKKSVPGTSSRFGAFNARSDEDRLNRKNWDIGEGRRTAKL